jgi:hypothetical protein
MRQDQVRHRLKRPSADMVKIADRTCTPVLVRRFMRLIIIHIQDRNRVERSLTESTRRQIARMLSTLRYA